MSTPVVIDLFCGLGGFSEGFLAEGYRCIGFDVERHRYAVNRAFEVPQYDQYPGDLVLQDVHTIHGRQFRNATCIVASPPCQEFSYMAMPWKRAKQIAAALRGECDPSGLLIPFPDEYEGSQNTAELTALFNACFRIQREACEAAGRHIPMIVENVKGAQPWVGPAKANYGSFYLWGDIGMANGNIVLPGVLKPGCFLRAPGKLLKGFGGTWFHNAELGTHNPNRDRSASLAEIEGRKVPNMNFHEFEKTGKPGRSFQSAAVESTQPGSSARKAASAQIAKIPFALSRWIAQQLKPVSPDQHSLALLQSGYDPERENGSPRRSRAWGFAQGWCDSLSEEAREWQADKTSPPSASISENATEAPYGSTPAENGGCER